MFASSRQRTALLSRIATTPTKSIVGRTVASLAILAGLIAWSTAPGSAQEAPGQPADDVGASPTSGRTIQSAYIPNQGQWPAEALFKGEAGDVEVWFTADGPIYTATADGNLVTPEDGNPAPADEDGDTIAEYHAVQLRYLADDSAGGSTVQQAAPELSYDDVQPGLYHFITGAGRWADVPGYGQVRMSEAFPGVDVLYAGGGVTTQDDLVEVSAAVKTTYVVKPGASVDAIRMRVEGADAVEIDAAGRLAFETRFGVMGETTPFAFQIAASGAREQVAAAWTLDGDVVGFSVGAYDAARALYIDPTVFYARDFGGSSDEYVYDLAADATHVYVCGMTESSNFPTTTGAFDETQGGLEDAYCAKFDRTTGDQAWATFVGSGDDEKAISMVLDGDEIIFTGFSDVDSFPDYPTTAGAFQTSQINSSDHGIVTRLSSDGSSLVCSTFVHATDTSGDTTFNGIAQFGDGSYLVGGVTEADAGWPNTGGWQATDPTGSTLDDGIIVRVSEDCSSVTAATYAGTTNTGNIEDSFVGDVYMQGGNAYALIVTDSEDFPTSPGAFDTEGDGTDNSDDLVVLKLSGDLSTLLYSTYLGDEGAISFSDENGGVFASFSRFVDQDQGWNGLYVNAAGEAYVTGITEGSDFPTTMGAFQETAPNASNTLDDAFVTILNAGATDLVASTYLGGAEDDDDGLAIDVDMMGNVNVVGETESNNFPTLNALDDTLDGFSDAFHVLLSADLSSQLCGTYFGGADDERAMGLQAEPGVVGRAIFGGWTESSDFPSTGGNIGSAPSTSENAFFAEVTCGGTTLEIDPDSVVVAPEAAGGRECVTAGDFVNISFDIVNLSPISDQPDAPGPEFTGRLTGRHVASGCTASSGTCTLTGETTLDFNGAIPAGERVTLTVRARVAGGVPAGAELCIEGTLFFDAEGTGMNTGMAEFEPVCYLTDCPPTVFPEIQLGSQVHLPILNFQGQDDVCETWIEVQNLGCDFAKAALITWGEPGFCPPQAAGPLKVECTGMLKPGSTWNLLGAQVPTGSKSGILFKFTTQQLSEIGVDLGFDDITGDYLCETLFFGVVGDADDYRRFKKAYNEGLEFAGVPLDRAMGDGVLAVDVHRTCPGDTTPGVEVTSKYNGLAADELGTFDDLFGGYGFYVPLIYADAADFNTIMYIQNGGLQCSSVEVWFKARDDCLRASICEILTLAPGESYQLDANDCVGPDFQGSAWLRSSQVMGIAVDIIGRDVLMTYVAEPAEINYTFDPNSALTRTAQQVAFGPLIYSEYQGWDTGVQVQNMSGVTAAKVKVYFLDRGGDIITTLVDWVCPRGSQTFFLPVIFDLPGNWVGSVRVESQEWFSPGSPLVLPPNITAVATLIKYNDAARTETTEAIAYNLLPEHKIYDWQIGFGGGSLDSGVGLIAIPSLIRDLQGTGVTSELAIANVVPKPGFTDLVIYFYDQNGLLDYVCQKLNEKQVEYIDLQTWGYINEGFKGSAIISAWFWEHDVFDDDGFFLRNLVGLGAVAIERKGTRLGEDIPGDEAAGARGIPFRQFVDEESDTEFEFCFMGYPPLCPGFPDNRFGEDGEEVCIPTPFGEMFMATMGAGDAGIDDFATYNANGRTFRDGVPSVCPMKTCPGGGFNAGTSFIYDLYYFQNCDGNSRCITVNLNTGACGTDVHAVAYAGRVPEGSAMDCMLGTAIYLGDVGGSLSQPFSFELPSGTTEWTLMFHNNFAQNPCGYGFDIVEN